MSAALPTPGAADGWWDSLYDEHLADVLLERDAAAVAPVVEFLWRQLGLGPGARVFDQCCGIGSLALPLAARGLRVVGCDLAAGYIARAQASARAQGLELDLQVADAFTFVPNRPCDGAFNWWTSFGYSRDDARNLEMLRRAWESLRPGGVFALDTMNVPGVLHGFARRVNLARETPQGLITLERESALDLERGLLHKRWTYDLPGGGGVTHDSTVRLHTPWELEALLRAAGFTAVEFVGDPMGGPLVLESPRCIALARRGR